MSFRVHLDDGRMRRCHQDYLRTRLCSTETQVVPTEQYGSSDDVNPPVRFVHGLH